MVKYFQKVKDLAPAFKHFEIFHISGAENAQVDTLFQLATTFSNFLGHAFIKYLEQSSINEVDKVLQINDEPSWMDPIIQYLTDGTLSKDPLEVKRLRWAASQYVLMDG